MKTFLGIPLWVCALVAFALSLVWTVFWPRDRAAASTGFRFFAIRWFHALTWLLLTLAALAAMLERAWSPAMSRYFALSSLAVYLLFLAVTLTTRHRP